MNKKILYLGPEGSYSYKVAKKLSKILVNYQLVGLSDFYTIQREVLKNIDFVGVLPFENSITSNIYENIEFIFDNDVNIIGEYSLPIELNIIGHKTSSLNDLKNVYSHPKALKQCSNFIEKNNLKSFEVSSTSLAQKIILDLDNSNFAIGDENIEKDLEIKYRNIGNYSNNKTRFIFVNSGNLKLPNTENKKITFLYKLPHKKGALMSFLQVIKDNNINITKIESKSIPSSEFEYRFLMECIDNDGKNIDVKVILDLLNKNTLESRICGVYQSVDM